MDVLTDVLRSMRSRSQMYGRFELTAPWGLRVEDAGWLSFYAVARGGVLLETAQGKLKLAAGDLVFIREGVKHTLKDHSRSRAIPFTDVYDPSRSAGQVSFGGGGPLTTLVAGGFSFEKSLLDPLIAYLPKILHVEGDMGAAHWVESTLQFISAEMRAESPGHALVASRLADVLFVHALRSFMRTSPCDAANSWLSHRPPPAWARLPADARTSPGAVDCRVSCTGNIHVAVRVRCALYGDAWNGATHVPHALAYAPRRGVARRKRDHRQRDRQRCRLRNRKRVHQGF